ncbi:GDP-mannose 4,6-dehydratase [Nitrosotalea devaniterrae]|uniref:GDP-mannose 4,6-dehydratase n=1 Tax=Nitrosotalea devaniterrae TaxID=1078905 RepID=A0A128A0L9_9ARCH|nr:GDP-mannose 4,6-dehydratase [Candidatus Nitrosotalea devanaterra]
MLLSKGYKVYGTFRRTSTPNFWRLMALDIYSKLHLIPADLLDMGSLIEAIKISDPHEVYNLAAASFVSTAFEQPVGNAEITGIAVTKLLESIRFLNPKIKFYQASSSEMFGNVNTKFQNENTHFSPASPYGVSKLYAQWITKVYRDAYGIFATNGLLFNHESPLRGIEFVSRKITNGVAKISLGLEKNLVLGNINAKRDWGFAPEYMEAVHLMLQQEKPGDFVISTGESHSVKDFAKLAFEIVGLDWRKFVKIDKRFFRPMDVDHLRGDYSKAKRKIGWQPKTNFEGLVKIMLNEDIKRWKMSLDGKFFPWDAPLYPNESKVITRLSKENIRSSTKYNNNRN